jgi:hypothetical protein
MKCQHNKTIKTSFNEDGITFDIEVCDDCGDWW